MKLLCPSNAPQRMDKWPIEWRLHVLLSDSGAIP